MNVPNAITIFRILLIPVFIWQFLEGNTDIAAIIFLIAWISDVLDGFIARKYNIVTDFGKFFDPFADKLITLTALFLMAYADLIHWIIPIIVLAKEATLAIGGAFMYKKLNKVVGAKWVGKIATFMFTVSIILMLFNLNPAMELFADIMLIAAMIVAFIALITYIINFFKVVKVEKSE